MDALVSGEISQAPQSYVNILKEEPKIAGNLTLVLYDLIIVAVEDGEHNNSVVLISKMYCILFYSHVDMCPFVCVSLCAKVLVLLSYVCLI